MRMPGFNAESSLRTAGRRSHGPATRRRSGSSPGGVVPQLLNTGGGPQNQDPTWCDLKHSLCMIGCSLKGIYWHFKFDGNVGVLPTACEMACNASRAVCRISL
jgi:hypothetical protein